MKKLETYLKNDIFNTNNRATDQEKFLALKKNKANTISETYSDIYQILQSNNWFRKNPLENVYSNKFVESDMGGDIKLDLDKFYNGFNKIYFSKLNNNYFPDGVGFDSLRKNLGISY